MHRVATLAVESILYEVSATPKPGLVDRSNSGAHRDMDFFTFMSSAAALHSVFDEMVLAGVHAQHKPIKSMWPDLRKAGIKAEELMFSATHNVNTHKGEIFSLGILCGCAGWQFGIGEKLDADTLMGLAGELCEGLCAMEFSRIHDKAEVDQTKGERIYLRYGFTGIRGEAESGYLTVKSISLPRLRSFVRRNIPINDALVQTLLYLIANTVDTNVISRHDNDTAEYVREYAEKVIKRGGMFTIEGREALDKMDEDFIEKNISPGGCADLLAVTYFLGSVK